MSGDLGSRLWLSFACAAVVACGAGDAGDRPASGAGEAALERALEEIRAVEQVPALGAAELRDGRVVEIAMVGSRRADLPDPARATDAVHLGSCGKAMTAALLALVAADGAIRFETVLAEAFPDERIDPALEEVTLYDLLLHRGGLAEDSTPSPEMLEHIWARGDASAVRAELARHVLSSPPSFPPRTEHHYANFGYVIVGAAIERATGRTFDALMRERLFIPLGMSSCGLGAPGEIAGHVRGDDGALRPTPGESGNPPALDPAGGIHCALEDWARFVDWFMRAPQSRRPSLSASAWSRLRSAGPDGQVPGWMITSRPWARGPIFTHAGSTGRFHAVVWALPDERRAFLAATNAGQDPGARATEAASRLVRERDL